MKLRQENEKLKIENQKLKEESERLKKKVNELEEELFGKKTGGYYSAYANYDMSLSDDSLDDSGRDIYSEIDAARLSLFGTDRTESNVRFIKIKRYVEKLKSKKEAEHLYGELNILKAEVEKFKKDVETLSGSKRISNRQAAENYTNWLNEAISHCEEILK